MTEGLIGALIGFLLACIGLLALKRRGRGSAAGATTTVFSSIENLRSVGELTAFRIHTKEIVTAENHSLGQWGKKYMNWLLSTKKMALILSFDTDFKYDLRSPDFQIAGADNADGTAIQMPPCYYDIRIRGISIYDEQEAKLLPWLLPDLVNSVFGKGFGPSEKNQLIEEAKNQAAVQARDLVRTMRSEVQESAAQTIKTLARGFGADDVRVRFADAAPVQKTIEYGAPEELADSGEVA
tara:strand:+ start:1910 stop:2626 length:717 start_codon:yes stop_codon:yes gene_type:complete